MKSSAAQGRSAPHANGFRHAIGTAVWTSRVTSLSGNCEFRRSISSQGEKVSKSTLTNQSINRLSHGCNGPHSRECVPGVSSQRFTCPCASSKLSPPGNLVLSHSTTLQSVVGSQIIAVQRAREVIPQPSPQPNQSVETRRCWQPRGQAVPHANLLIQVGSTVSPIWFQNFFA